MVLSLLKPQGGVKQIVLMGSQNFTTCKKLIGLLYSEFWEHWSGPRFTLRSQAEFPVNFNARSDRRRWEGEVLGPCGCRAFKAPPSGGSKRQIG